MLNPKDFRIGNYVEYDKRIFEFIEIINNYKY